MKKTFFLLALLAAFPPLSTDMYLAAIPILQKQWQQPLASVNLTLIFFFISYCFFLLIYGPVSDRYGRRPPLITGIVIFILASLMCAFSKGLTELIVFRIVQGAGAAGASAISLAICKDIYEGREREKVLAHLAVAIGLAPMLAPVFGGWLLSFFPWPSLFFSQAALAGLALAGVWKMKEPYRDVSDATVWRQLANYIHLLGNGRFLILAVITSISMLPLFAFIAGCSDIYINKFSLSEQVFGLFFGANALAYMTGSFVCSRLVRRVPSRHLMSAGFTGIPLAGMILLLSARHTPWGLALPMFIMSFSIGLCRPPGTNLALEQVQRSAGAAASFLVFTLFVFGATAMWLISWDWSDKMDILGWMGLSCGALTLGGWFALQRVLKLEG